MKLSYDNRIVTKPWGEEYVIFKNKNKIAITYLKIKKGQSTSLHCHPQKKTGFLILSGSAKVQLGIYKKNTFIYKPMSILVLRAGLFHKIKASKFKDLYALEIENPYIKKDLIRIEDTYGRKNKDYEGLSNTKKITKYHQVFKKPYKKKKHVYNLNKITIELSYYKNFKRYSSINDRSVSIILDGSITTRKGTKVIGIGEIVKSLTLKKLSEYFPINKKILILKAKK
jgi:mannose-6-phosphate isomerase-like protein (cupin superfamily)